jgi:hypothetical protein
VPGGGAWLAGTSCPWQPSRRRAGLSSGLIRLRTGASSTSPWSLLAEVTDLCNLPRTPIHRLGKRVGGNPSGVRISYPLPP